MLRGILLGLGLREEVTIRCGAGVGKRREAVRVCCSRRGFVEVLLRVLRSHGVAASVVVGLLHSRSEGR